MAMQHHVMRWTSLFLLLLIFITAGPADGGTITPEELCYPVADVVFLLDGSDSISDPEFSQQKDFLRRFVKVSDVGSERIRVGFAVVSSTIGDSMGLAGTTTKNEVLNKVKKIAQPQEGSRIDLGLVQLEQMLLSEGRRGEVQIGVILTDGRAKYERATEGEAVAVKSSGTFLIAVGVGRLIQDGELEKIASTPSDAFHLMPIDTSLKLLSETVNYLGRQWCSSITQQVLKTKSTHALKMETSPAPSTITSTTTPSTTTTVTTQTTSPTTSKQLQWTTLKTTKLTTPATTTEEKTTTTVTRPTTVTEVTTKITKSLIAETASVKYNLTVNYVPSLTTKTTGKSVPYVLPKSKWGIVTHRLFDIGDLPHGVPINIKHIKRGQGHQRPARRTTTLPPSTTTTHQTVTDEHNHDTAEHMCRNSRFVDGVGYTFHANSCTEFLQCFYNAGKVSVEIARCPFRTFFDERYMICRPFDQRSCFRDPCFDFTVESYEHKGNCRAYWSCETGLSRPKCCPLGFTFKTGQGCVQQATCTDACMESGAPTFNTPFSSCRMTPLETNDQFYFEKIPGLGMMIRTCPRGSRFEASLCTCDTAEDVIKSECRPKMYIDFQDGFSDKSGNNLALTHTNVMIEKGAGRFSGFSSMKLWRFSSVSFGHNFAIKLKFKVNSTAREGEPMHLVSNCCSGCRGIPGPSIDMVVFPDRFGGIAMFSASSKKSGERFVDIPFTTPASGWNEASYHYNGAALIGSVNGVEGKQNMAGEIESREDPIAIGSCDGTGNFNGLIDEFKLFLCSPR